MTQFKIVVSKNVLLTQELMLWLTLPHAFNAVLALSITQLQVVVNAKLDTTLSVKPVPTTLNVILASLHFVKLARPIPQLFAIAV